MKKKIQIIIVCMLAMTMLFASCTKQPTESGTVETPEAAEATEGATEEGVIFKAPALPITNEDISLRIVISPPERVVDMETNLAAVYLEELVGVDIEWDLIPTGTAGTEKLNLMLAAQADLPDAFWVTTLNMNQTKMYGKNGLFIGVDEYLDDYAPNYVYALENDPMMYKQLQADGTLYGFPKKNLCTHCNRASRMWINQTWLDNLGLDTPTTIDEYYAVLKAFKENDANGNGDKTDEIPLAAAASGWKTDIMTFIGNSYLPTTERLIYQYMYIEDGTIKSAATDDRFKEALKFMRQLRSEELLDEEAFTMTVAQAKALTGAEAGNRIGSIAIGNGGAFVDTTVPGARDEYVALAPLEGSEGVQGTPVYHDGLNYMTMITNECEYPEAMVRIADLFMYSSNTEDDEGMETYLNLKLSPKGWRWANDGEVGLDGEPAYFAKLLDFMATENTEYATYPEWAAPGIDERRYTAVTQDDGVFPMEKILWDASTITYEPYGKDIVIPELSIAEADETDFAEYTELLESHMEMSIASFILGTRDIDAEWDAYKAELESYGLSECIRIKQDAYDAMYK
jgi:putative aldouronate transport system substrate-binding protein